MTWRPMPPPGIEQYAEQFGPYMTALCREAGVSQAAIAADIGYTDRLFRGYLNGERTTRTACYPLQYLVESYVGADVVRKVRRQFGMSMPRMPKEHLAA